MKFSESWLREWVNPAISSEQLCDQLTMAGLEVDDIENVAGDFSGVVVGRVVECHQHPNADKFLMTIMVLLNYLKMLLLVKISEIIYN